MTTGHNYTYGNTADVVPVWKVGYAESFFGINKNRPDLKRDLDVAMNRLFEDNRDFNQQLTEKFNKASAVNSFLTSEEKRWLADHGAIRVGYRENFLPFCGVEEASQSLTGSLADFLQFAETCEKNAKLTFETRAFETTEAALQALENGEIDCMFPINITSYDGEKRGIVAADPIVVTEMYAVVRTVDHQGVSKDREMTVAVLEGHPNHVTFLMDNFPNWSIKYYPDSVSALEAGEGTFTASILIMRSISSRKLWKPRCAGVSRSPSPSTGACVRTISTPPASLSLSQSLRILRRICRSVYWLGPRL